MTSPWSDLRAELAQRESEGLLRRRRLVDGMQQPVMQVDGAEVLSFCSNDYLGLAADPRLIAAMQETAASAGAGSGASHLITGHHRMHQMLEQALAAFVGLPAALTFSTGYMANLAVVTALVGRHDAIFADKLNHASLNDAAVLSRASLNRYAHQDLEALEQMLAASSAKRKLVLADAVFSMDGDLAPVPVLLALRTLRCLADAGRCTASACWGNTVVACWNTSALAARIIYGNPGQGGRRCRSLRGR